MTRTIGGEKKGGGGGRVERGWKEGPPAFRFRIGIGFGFGFSWVLCVCCGGLVGWWWSGGLVGMVRGGMGVF